MRARLKERKVKFDHELMRNITHSEYCKRHPESGLAKKYAAIKERKNMLTEKQAERERKNAMLGTMIAMGVKEKDALVAAGYSGNSNLPLKHHVVVETISQVRERLQNDERYGLEGAVKFYDKIAQCEEESANNKIKARNSIDKLLGLNAPAKVEVSETRDLNVAINVLKQLNINPADVIALAKETDAEILE